MQNRLWGPLGLSSPLDQAVWHHVSSSRPLPRRGPLGLRRMEQASPPQLRCRAVRLAALGPALDQGLLFIPDGDEGSKTAGGAPSSGAPERPLQHRDFSSLVTVLAGPRDQLGQQMEEIPYRDKVNVIFKSFVTSFTRPLILPVNNIQHIASRSWQSTCLKTHFSPLPASKTDL